MPGLLYNQAAGLLRDGTLGSATFQIALLGTKSGGYAFDPAHTVLDNGHSDATSPKHNELVATNYARKAATYTLPGGHPDTFRFSDVTWAALGGAVNDTIAAAVLVIPGVDDAATRLVAYWGTAGIPTDGQDFTAVMDQVAGNLRVATAAT